MSISVQGFLQSPKTQWVLNRLTDVNEEDEN